MAILRLNDGKHFVAGSAEQKKERVYGHINADGKLNISQEECKVIKKLFEPLYSNHLQFMGKVIEAQKAQKVLEADLQAKEQKIQISKTSEQLAEKYRQRKEDISTP